MANINYEDQARDMLNSIVNIINTDYDKYVNELIEEGKYDFYNEQTDFVRRMMFYNRICRFSSYPNRFRRRIRDFILDSWCYNYKEEAIPRAEAICKAINENRKYYYAINVDCDETIKNILAIREALIKENPIFSNPIIHEADRRRMVNVLFKQMPEYKNYRKNFDRFIKDVVARIVTHEIEANDHVHGID